MELIDYALVREQFDSLPGETVRMLVKATTEDIGTCAAALIDGHDRADESDIRDALHSLIGICGNFGAERLVEIASQPIDDVGLRADLADCVRATIAAIATVAAEVLAEPDRSHDS